MSQVVKHSSGKTCEYKIENIENIMNRIEKETIVVPPFQREPSWQLSAKQSYIESLIKGYPGGVIYLRKVIIEDGTQLWEIVDGRNRLTSIKLFLSGRITNRNNFETLSKEEFKKIEMCIGILTNYTNHEIEDFFYVIQKGTPLHSGEKLIASKSAIRILFTNDNPEIYERFSRVCEKIGIKNEHRSHLTIACTIAVMCIHGHLKNLDNFRLISEYMEKTTVIDFKWKECIEKVLTIFCDAFEKETIQLLKSEVISICLLIRHNLPIQWKGFGKFYCDTFAKRRLHTKTGLFEYPQTEVSIDYYKTTRTSSNSHAKIMIRHEILEKQFKRIFLKMEEEEEEEEEIISEGMTLDDLLESYPGSKEFLKMSNRKRPTIIERGFSDENVSKRTKK